MSGKNEFEEWLEGPGVFAVDFERCIRWNFRDAKCRGRALRVAVSRGNFAPVCQDGDRVMELDALIAEAARYRSGFFLRQKSNYEWEAGWGPSAGPLTQRADTPIDVMRGLVRWASTTGFSTTPRAHN